VGERLLAIGPELGLEVRDQERRTRRVHEQRVVDAVGAEALEHLHEVVAVGDQQIDLPPVEAGEVAEAQQAAGQ